MGSIRSVKSAFTLIETICVVAIISVLTSFLFPIMASVLISSKEVVTMGQFRNLHVAIKLYQTDYDGDGKYGSASEMGLLPAQRFFDSEDYMLYSPNRELWSPPCGKHPQLNFGPPFFAYFPGDELTPGERPAEPWPSYATTVFDSAALMADFNCTDQSIPLFAPRFRKKLIVLRLSGTITRRNIRSGLTEYREF